MKIKRFFTGAWIILCPFFLSAQDTSGLPESQISFGAGIGASAYPAFFAIIESLDESGSFKTSSGPAFTGYLEWNLNRRLSLGINGGFQKLSQEVSGFSFTASDSLYTVDRFNYSLNRTNIGLTLKLYYDNSDQLDLYSGLKAGMSIFKIKVDVSDNLLINELENNLRFPMTTPAFQLIIFGMKYYPTQYIGLFGELSVGAPAIVQAGLSVRIPYTK